MLLIHGFAATPQEVRGLGDHLAAGGCEPRYVTLAGHGTSVADFRRSTAEDWYGSVVRGWEEAAAGGRPVDVVGISLGAALAVRLAAHLPVRSVVLVSPVIELARSRLFGLPREFLIRTFGRIIPGVPTFGRVDIVEKGNRHLVGPEYRFYPSTDLRELLKAMRVALAAAPQVTAPCLVIHSRRDRTAAFRGSERLLGALGSREKELVALDGVGHVILADRGHEAVFAEIEAFLRR